MSVRQYVHLDAEGEHSIAWRRDVQHDQVGLVAGGEYPRDQREPGGQILQLRQTAYTRPDERAFVHDADASRDARLRAEHEQPVVRHRLVHRFE